MTDSRRGERRLFPVEANSFKILAEVVGSEITRLYLGEMQRGSFLDKVQRGRYEMFFEKCELLL